MKLNEKLRQLRDGMNRHNIDAYIVPSCDFHGSEYIGDYFKTREFISGFTGSAGTVVVTMKEACLWTDGRYFLQAREQLKDSEILLMESGQPGVPSVKEYLSERMSDGCVIGFDGRMMSCAEAENLSSIEGVLVNGQPDLVGEIWSKRPALSCNPIWKLGKQYTGMSYLKKIEKIRESMGKNECDALILTSLDEVAWTMNLRGSDVKCTPVFLAFMIITRKESVLFVQKGALNDEIKKSLIEQNIMVRDYFEIYQWTGAIINSRIWIDKETANYNLIKMIDDSNTIINKFTPPLLMKAEKNHIETENIRRAHLADGAAMTKFIFWLKHNVGKVALSEVSLGECLEGFRRMSKNYLGPGFEPIVGYKEHGAIVHYSATKDSDYDIVDDNIVLIDSGGQYLEGTTDITRTISLGKVTDKMRELYTAVLRGNLNLASAVFKEGCTGVSLDYIARKPLWDKGLDYNHGTGHGVGYLLNVHEQPNAFRYRIADNRQLNAVLKPGMVTSDEPGVYIEGEFGIRLENLILCVEKESNEFGNFLGFETLTLVPFDKELIDRKQMTSEERRLLDDYHKIVYEKISPYLTKEESEWLRSEIS